MGKSQTKKKAQPEKKAAAVAVHKGFSGFYRRSGRDDVKGVGDKSCSV
jgi:hypothetical protein